MKVEEYVKYCLLKVGAVEEFIFKDKIQTCTVGGKKFCVVCDNGGKYGLALKSEIELNIVLRQKYSGILLPKNFDNRYWNIVMLDSDIPDVEIKFLIDLSYKLVYDSLTRKVRESLG